MTVNVSCSVLEFDYAHLLKKWPPFGERIVQLRREGKSRRQIKEILGPMSNSTLDDALKGEPPPEWTRRPNAKDDVRGARPRAARAGPGLRGDRRRPRRIQELGLAVGARPPPPGRVQLEECRKRAAEGARRYWAAERQVARPARAAARAAAAAQIGVLTDRELLIAGAIAYWCEGAKNKPDRRADRVIFTNSDPALIRFFLRFLEATGTPRTTPIFRIYIHESADVEAAQRFWLEVTGASA